MHSLVSALHAAAAASPAVLDALVYLRAPDALLSVAESPVSLPATSVAALRATILLSSRAPQPPSLATDQRDDRYVGRVYDRSNGEACNERR
jgi:hypothetical protein